MLAAAEEKKAPEVIVEYTNLCKKVFKLAGERIVEAYQMEKQNRELRLVNELLKLQLQILWQLCGLMMKK